MTIHRKSKLTCFVALMLLSLIFYTFPANALAAQQNIPEQAIRLRILANSDTQFDQMVKRSVRDRIVRLISSNMKSPLPRTLEEARSHVKSQLPTIRQLVQNQLNSFEVPYRFKIKLGMALFPAKMYAGTIYPAGKYEALVITLGAGAGQNWWCVLFPPLCFVDATQAEPSADVVAGSANVKPAQTKKVTNKNEPRFFIWEWLRSVFRTLFA